MPIQSQGISDGFILAGRKRQGVGSGGRGG